MILLNTSGMKFLIIAITEVEQKADFSSKSELLWRRRRLITPLTDGPGTWFVQDYPRDKFSSFTF